MLAQLSETQNKNILIIFEHLCFAFSSDTNKHCGFEDQKCVLVLNMQFFHWEIIVHNEDSKTTYLVVQHRYFYHA